MNALEIIKNSRSQDDPDSWQEITKNISSNPAIMDGIPVFSGTRIPVYIIVDCFAEGMSMDQILKDYPSLDKQKIKVALKFAEWLSALH